MKESISIIDNITKIKNSGMKEVIVLLKCDIISKESVTFNIEIFNQDEYIKHYDIVQERIQRFKAHCRERAEILEAEVFIWN